MQYSTGKLGREIDAHGMEFDPGSVYDRLCQLTDLRGANGKRYELAAILLIVMLAKLCGEDKPLGIAEWARHRKAELVKLLCLNWPSMPHHNTYRRILAYKVYEQEVERLTISAVNMARCMRWMGRRDEGCARRTRQDLRMA